jgi:hypothetical protein
VKITHLQDAVVIQNLQYDKLKLFLMSLLWRMGISKLPFFKQVDLGLHLEKLRLALLGEDPLPAERYPCLLVAVQFSGKRLSAARIFAEFCQIAANCENARHYY